MQKLTDEQLFNLRAQKIEGWLEIYEEMYGDLISRPEETSSVAGFDSGPTVRPCECLARWQRGRLCLACDNTGWRKKAPGEEGIDPYSTQVRNRSSFKLVESDAAQKAHAAARIDVEIAVLERNAMIREGLEAAEDRDTRSLRLVSHKHRSLVKILDALKQLLAVAPNALAKSRGVLARALAHLVSGRIYPPPTLALSSSKSF